MNVSFSTLFLLFFSDNLVKEWDMGTCTCLRTLQGHKGPVLCLQVRLGTVKVVSLPGQHAQPFLYSLGRTVHITDLKMP